VSQKLSLSALWLVLAACGGRYEDAPTRDEAGGATEAPSAVSEPPSQSGCCVQHQDALLCLCLLNLRQCQTLRGAYGYSAVADCSAVVDPVCHAAGSYCSCQSADLADAASPLERVEACAESGPWASGS
jgi:hypothetical protein